VGSGASITPSPLSWAPQSRKEETTMVNPANWDKFSKRIILGLLMAAVVAACFLLLGIYIVGAGI
jgi:hypothetical protein